MKKTILLSTILMVLTLGGISRAALPPGLHLNKDGVIVNAKELPVPIAKWTMRDDHICPPGMHIPSIREFAKISVSKGAKIQEIMNGSPDVPAGFDFVDAVNSDGKRDQFYYSNLKSTQAPQAKCFYDLYWSSSARDDLPNFNYTMTSSCGALWQNNEFDQMFPKCVHD